VAVCSLGAGDRDKGRGGVTRGGGLWTDAAEAADWWQLYLYCHIMCLSKHNQTLWFPISCGTQTLCQYTAHLLSIYTPTPPIHTTGMMDAAKAADLVLLTAADTSVFLAHNIQGSTSQTNDILGTQHCVHAQHTYSALAPPPHPKTQQA
jgi:hypothetical protein